MKSAHFNHKMIPLKNGDILIFDNQYDYNFSQSTEIFKVRKGVKNEWTLLWQQILILKNLLCYLA